MFQNSLIDDQVNLRKNRTVLFQGRHGQFLVSIKQPGQDIWKKTTYTTSSYNRELRLHTQWMTLSILISKNPS